MNTNVSDEWWIKNAIWPGMDEKKTVEIMGNFLTHVASVKVCAPPDRENLRCSIYGEISFSVGVSGESVTLFRRAPDNPEPLDLADEDEGCYLTLSDHHESSQRALGEVSDTTPLRVKMKLYEKNCSGGEDAMIAQIDHCDSGCRRNLSYYFVLTDQESRFGFELGYSVSYGARVEVEIKIASVAGGGGVSMWGEIGAYQCLATLPPLYPDGDASGETYTTLLNICESEPVSLDVGKVIQLKRSSIVAPMRNRGYLCIYIAPVMDNEKHAVGEDEDDPLQYYEVYFPLSKVKQSFGTNKQLTHTKHIEHAGTMFAVSIRFSPPSLKRSRSWEYKHDE